MLRNNLLNPLKIIVSQFRPYYHRSTPKTWKEDGVQYGLVTYYPRHRDHKDPPITPSKLFLVTRVMPLKFNPWWETDILKEFNLDSKRKKKHTSIVMNTPENCLKLWKIKHLIKVVPIDMPDRLPDIDAVSTILDEDGKLHICRKIDQTRYEATEKFLKNKKRLDGDTLREWMRLTWLNAME